LAQLKGTYYPYCEMSAATYDAFINASSMGQYYNANIKGSGKDGPFDCRTHVMVMAQVALATSHLTKLPTDAGHLSINVNIWAFRLT
jgi:hypothetical protein